jgi:hypothetical protein
MYNALVTELLRSLPKYYTLHTYLLCSQLINDRSKIVVSLLDQPTILWYHLLLTKINSLFSLVKYLARFAIQLDLRRTKTKDPERYSWSLVEEGARPLYSSTCQLKRGASSLLQCIMYHIALLFLWILITDSRYLLNTRRGLFSGMTYLRGTHSENWKQENKPKGGTQSYNTCQLKRGC